MTKEEEEDEDKKDPRRRRGQGRGWGGSGLEAGARHHNNKATGSTGGGLLGEPGKGSSLQQRRVPRWEVTSVLHMSEGGAGGVGGGG